MARKLYIAGSIPVELSEEVIQSIVDEYLKDHPSTSDGVGIVSIEIEEVDKNG